MSSKEMKTSEHILSIVLKAIIMHEHHQDLTDDATELVWCDNNDQKVKHDCLKKLTVSDIW